MKLSEQYFFELLQVAIGNRDSLSHAPTEVEWGEIYETAKKQTLIGIAFKGVEKLPQEQLPSRMKIRQWLVMADRIRKKNVKMNIECARTCFILHKNGFHSCILKGQANFKNYRPSESSVNGNFDHSQEGLGWYRTPGDIDVWTWSDRGEVCDVIKFTKRVCAESEPYYHHVECNLSKDVETEVHYRPSWMSAPWRNRVFQRFCQKHKTGIVRQYIPLPDNRRTFFYVPGIDFDAVYQLVHIYRHLFAEGIGLRQMLDYYMVLQQLDDEQRQTALGWLRRLGMKNFASATMYVMQQVFAMNAQFLLCAPNEKEGSFLLREIMLAGNFGHEDERYTITREESALRWGIMKLKRNMKFLTSYPEEVICEPLFRVFHWTWRKFRLWKPILSSRSSRP